MVYQPNMRASDQADRTDRQKEAWRLHLHGHGIRAIAEMLGSNRETIRVDIQRELAAIKEDNVELAKQFRDEAVERLRALLIPLMPLADAGDKKAAEECRKIVMDMSRLVGILVEKTEVSVTPTDVDAVLAALTQRADVTKG